MTRSWIAITSGASVLAVRCGCRGLLKGFRHSAAISTKLGDAVPG